MMKTSILPFDERNDDDDEDEDDNDDDDNSGGNIDIVPPHNYNQANRIRTNVTEREVTGKERISLRKIERYEDSTLQVVTETGEEGRKERKLGRMGRSKKGR